MHAQLLCLHLWILVLLLVIARNDGLTDWALGYNCAMLVAHMLLNFVTWSKNG